MVALKSLKLTRVPRSFPPFKQGEYANRCAYSLLWSVPDVVGSFPWSFLKRVFLSWVHILRWCVIHTSGAVSHKNDAYRFEQRREDGIRSIITKHPKCNYYFFAQ